VSPLDRVAGWPVRATAGWLRTGRAPEVSGPAEETFEWASVTKVVTAVAVWIAVEEGVVGWDDAAGPPGATLRHLLAHASGMAPDSTDSLAPPGRSRIYSNSGFEAAAAHVASQSGIAFAEYAREAVLEPLDMRGTRLDGSPASGARGPLVDLLRLAAELLEPRLVAPQTVTLARSAAFPGLVGVLPGFGRQDPNDWGLGVEIRDAKHPHWTGSRNSPSTFGHFGRSGSFIWVDPAAGVAVASLAEQSFGPWATEAWPDLSDAILEASATRS
jgi:CubicO group peptidase (beta-lactamase class C family)